MPPPELLRERLDRLLWQPSGHEAPAWRGALRRVLRVLYVLLRDLGSGALTLRAMGLVYTTLLSLVPLLALSFSVLKGFGVHNQLAPLLSGFLEPLGERGDELMRRILGFIENVNVGVLGAVGLALLLYTVISLVQKVEESFNFIWHVSQSRGIGERFSRYLSVLLVGPLLVFAAMGMTASVMSSDWVRVALSWRGMDAVAGLLEAVVPYLLVTGAFLFAYAFIPNTRVRFAPAAAGALVAGLLWQSAGWAFAMFAGSSTQYSAIYSGFAIVILFMIWLYVSWLIVLFGSSVAFYVQYPQYLVPLGGEPRLSNRVRERVAVAVGACIASRYRRGAQPPTADELAGRLGVPVHGVAFVLDALVEGGLLARAEAGRYLPARDLAGVSVHQLLEMVRTSGERRTVAADMVLVPAAARRLLERADAEASRVLGEASVLSLGDPAVEDEERADEARPPRGT